MGVYCYKCDNRVKDLTLREYLDECSWSYGEVPTVSCKECGSSLETEWDTSKALLSLLDRLEAIEKSTKEV